MACPKAHRDEVCALRHVRVPSWPGMGASRWPWTWLGPGCLQTCCKGSPAMFPALQTGQCCLFLSSSAARTAGAVPQQWAALICSARLLMLPAQIAGPGREGGPVHAGRRGSHACAAGRHLAAVLQVSLWGRQGPLAVPAITVHGLCMMRSRLAAQPWSPALQLTKVVFWSSPQLPALLASFAALGWPTCDAKVGLRLCCNLGAGICSLWLRSHRSAGT